MTVFLHGAGDSCRTWHRIGPRFAQAGWKAVALDLRGHGSNPSSAAASSLMDLAEDVYETLTSLPGQEHQRIDVMVGHSLGALVAMKSAETYPELLRKVILEDPPGTRSVDFRSLSDELVERAITARADPTAWIERLQVEQSWLSQDDAVRMASSLIECDAPATAKLFRSIADLNVASLASRVCIPALLVLADEQCGSFLLGSERRDMELAMGDGPTITVPAQHYVHLEAEDEYYRVVHSWLRGENEPYTR